MFDTRSVTQILSDFFNIIPTHIKLIKAGVENENFIIHTAENKKYIFRVYNEKHSIRGLRSKEEINLELNFVESARRAGVEAPQVIENNQGQKVTEITFEETSRFVAVFTFLSGKSLQKYSEKSAQELGNVVDILFSVGQSFSGNDLQMTSDIYSRAVEKYESLQQSEVVVPDVLEKIWTSTREQFDALKNLSKGLVHGDLKLENIFFDDQENLTAVLDFDDFRFSFLLEEAVMALMHNLHSSEENLLRSGNYDNFVGQFKNETLLKEMRHLSLLLKTRFIYDCSKYLLSGKDDLVEELLDDKEVIQHILS